MASLSRSYPAIELDYTLGGDSDVTSLSSGDIDLTRPEILQIVLEADEFVTKYDLADIREIIRKGALLFYHPHNLAQIEEEMGYLENQGNSIKGPGKPPGSSVSIAICYAAMFLCDFLGSSAPIEVFYPRLDEGQPYLGSEGLWFWEYPKGFWETVLLYSLAPLVSALLGFWLSLSLNRYWGRRRAFSVAAALALVAIFDRFLCHDWEYLAIADIFARVATTMLNCTSFLYIAEISEASRRSSTVAKWYFGSSLLSMVAQFIYDPALLSFIISTLAACVVLGLSIQIPDSPYWLTLNGKVHEAHESLRSLRDTEIIAARDLYQIYILDGQSDLRNGNLTWPKPLPRLSELFTNRRPRVVLMTAISLTLSRIFSDIHLRSMVFGQIELPDLAFHSIIIPHIGGYCVVFLAALMFDRLERRRTLISLYCGMVISLLGQSLASSHREEALSLFSRSCFFIFHPVSELVLVVYISEVFPLYYREMGVAIIFSFFYAGVEIFPTFIGWQMIMHIPSSGLHILISLLISILLAYLFMKETNKLPLESVGSALEPFPKGLISYRVYVHLPYLFRRYVLRRQIELVSFGEHRYSEGGIALDSENTLSM